MHSPRATRALQWLAETDPAVGLLALWCPHRDATPQTGPASSAAPSVAPPAWTDGTTVFYGPGFETLDLPCQAGVAAHQVLHVALRHVQRGRALHLRLGDGFDEPLFQIATDAILNEALIAAGHLLPRPCLTLCELLAAALGRQVPRDQALADWDCESLYRALAAPGPDLPPTPRQTPQQGRRGSDQGSGAGEGSGNDPAARARALALRQGHCPDMDLSQADPGGPPALAQASADWRGHVIRALGTGAAAGRGLGVLGFRLADLPRATIPWERHLRHLLGQALSVAPRPDWARPSRSHAALCDLAQRQNRPEPPFAPGLRRLHLRPRVVLALDASGSVTDQDLALLSGQVAAIARRSGAALHLLVFDTGLHVDRPLPAHEAARALRALVLPRGGGTDFGPMLARAQALAPSALVVLTDLEAPLPPRPGRLPVIWAVPAAPPLPPAWGRVIVLAH